MFIANIYDLKFDEIVGNENAQKLEEFLKDYFEIVDIVIQKVDDEKFETIRNKSLSELEEALQEINEDENLTKEEIEEMLNRFKEFSQKASVKDKLKYKFSTVNDILRKLKIKDIIQKIKKNEDYHLIFDDLEFTFTIDELKKIYEVLKKYNMIDNKENEKNEENEENIDFFKNKYLWDTDLFPSLLILLSQNNFRNLFYFIITNLEDEIKKIDNPDIQEIILKAFEKKELYYYEVNKFLGYIFLTESFNKLDYGKNFGNKSTYIFLALNSLYEKFKKNNLKKEFETIINLEKE